MSIALEKNNTTVILRLPVVSSDLFSELRTPGTPDIFTCCPRKIFAFPLIFRIQNIHILCKFFALIKVVLLLQKNLQGPPYLSFHRFTCLLALIFNKKFISSLQHILF